MPDAPHVSFFTHYVLEWPLPVAVVLLAIAGAFGFVALRDGRLNFYAVAGGLALLAGAIYALGSVVETSGEKAEDATLAFEKLAVAGNVSGAMAMFADSAVLTLVSPTSEAQSLEYIRNGLNLVATRYPIDDNRVTQLRGYTVDSDHAIVHMTCMTDIHGTSSQSRWVLSVRRQADDSWKIDKLTWVDFNRQKPTTGLLR